MIDLIGSGAPTPTKPCVLCGAECAGRPRVKDPRGRYYCRPCYDTRKAEKALAESQSAPSLADHDASDFTALARSASGAPVAAATHLTCPACHRQLDAGSVFCVGCGHNLRTGLEAETAVEAPILRPPVVARRARDSWEFRLGRTATLAIAFVTVCAESLPTVTRGFSKFLTNPGWLTMIGVTVLASLIGALLYGLIMPWWFRVRVQWCGGDAEPEAAASAYFVTVLPYTLIAIIGASYWVLSHSTPQEAASARTSLEQRMFGVLGLIALALMCVRLLFIAMKSFGARMGPAVALLVVLPWLRYGGALALSTVIAGRIAEISPSAIEGAGSTSTPPPTANVDPDATTAMTLDDLPGYPIELSYPSSWKVSRSTNPGHLGPQIQFLAKDGTNLLLTITTSPYADRALVEDVVRTYGKNGAILISASTDLDEFGPWSGVGQSLRGKLVNRPVKVKVFVSPRVGAARLIVEAFVPDPDRNDTWIDVERLLWTIRSGNANVP